MKYTALLLLLAACGGGSGSTSAYDPVTHVTLVETVEGGMTGRSDWDDRGSSVEILDGFEYRDAVLKHELWHLLTRRGDHPNDADETCVSTGDQLRNPLVPCPIEVEQVNEAGRVVTLSFPDDPECAHRAAAWWNEACGREAVVVVD